eukprot:Skav213147  [mRNA]  locus=scaffold107:570844:571155:- [translate_table: standard]
MSSGILHQLLLLHLPRIAGHIHHPTSNCFKALTSGHLQLQHTWRLRNGPELTSSEALLDEETLERTDDVGDTMESVPSKQSWFPMDSVTQCWKTHVLSHCRKF